MNMLYKLILVDDEDWILDGIKNAIEWENIGFQVTGTFTNGRDALNAIRMDPPDAILTDIKMPIQDGISLVKELREAGFENLEVVFLSGYDDFELAQSSLRLGAVDYVLKPSAPEQIVEVFDRIKGRLDARGVTTDLVQAGIKVFKDAVYNSIMSGNDQEYHRFMTLYSEFVERERGKAFVVISVAPESVITERMPTEQDVENMEYFQHLVGELQGQKHGGINIIENLYSYSLVFCGYSEDAVEALLEGLKRSWYKKTREKLNCARSDLYGEFYLVKAAYESSLARLFRLDMPEPVQQLYFKLGNDAVLKAAIEDRDQQVVFWSLKNWMLKIEDTNCQYRWRMMRRLLYSLSVFFLQNDISYQEISILYEAVREEDCESVKTAVISFVKSELMAAKKGNKTNSRNVHLCKAVAKYISRNYTEEITLNELSEQFYISPNYLGTLFKKNIGVGIKEYQTAIRLEQAEALIASGKFKLYQVAQMVGYPNYEYFRKMYYKYNNKNPSE